MKSVSKEAKRLIFSVVIVMGFFSSSVVFGIGLTDFGGSITTVIPCTCSSGSRVTIIGKGRNARFSGTYLYLPGTPKGSITSGKNILGKYSSGGTCTITAYPKCLNRVITKGTIKIFRTN